VIALTLREIADIVEGRVEGDPELVVTAPASVDSRSVEPGGLFVAFSGEHVDGHDYASAALASGAAAVLGTRATGAPGVVVDDALEALGRLAGAVVRRLPEVTVVALTGSQGKTTTKDLLAALLGAAAPTVATPGSLNNEIGLPLTVLRADPSTRYLVLEMGARGIGHLTYLCGIAPPRVSLVLNVGTAHIGEFGSQEAIARAKSEIVSALGPGGIAVLNADDPRVAAMAELAPGRVVSFGESPGSGVRGEGLTLDPGGRPSFDVVVGDERVPVRLRLVGEHQAWNALAALAVGVALGLPLPAAAQTLGRVESTSKWRMQVQEAEAGITLVNDAYNANPESMRAALKALAAMGRGSAGGGRTVAVLGEMLELGESSRDEHDAIGRLAVRLDIGQLLVIGEPARPLHLGASLEGSWGEESVFVPDKAAAATWLRTNLRPGDVVLLKASRGVGLEELADVVLGTAHELSEAAS
jgi:UDP-N-acetylmuramoyl-tripeptide--D-alanyl-D-alanine ligase